MPTMRATPGRILVLSIGIPVLLAAVGDGALTATGLLARSSAKHVASYPWHGGTLSLHNDDGNVTVRRSSSVSAVSVTYTEHFGVKKPTVTGQSTASGVQLTAHCPGGLFAQFCSVNYVVLVPAGAAVQLSMGDGSVALDGVDGSVDVDAGDGHISGANLTSQQLSVSAGDGSVSLQWSAAPAHVEVSIGDGNLSVGVPSGSGPYAITKEMGDGSDSISVAEDPKASRSLVLKMGDGNLSVH